MQSLRELPDHILLGIPDAVLILRYADICRLGRKTDCQAQFLLCHAPHGADAFNPVSNLHITTSRYTEKY